MNVCGDTLCAVANSPASETEISVLCIQIRLLIKPLQQNKKTHQAPWAQTSSHTGAPVSLSLSTLTLLFLIPFFILNLLHFSNRPSPSLFFTLHCLFSDCKMSFSIFRCSPLPFASLPLSSQPFSVLLKDCWAVGDSSVWLRWCFLISMMSDNSASGSCVFTNTLSICKSPPYAVLLQAGRTLGSY